MKHINESIIGRKGTYSSSKLWLLYPVGDDYQNANCLMPMQCRVYYAYVGLFCVDRQQLKEYFSRNLGFKCNKSTLFEVNPRYLRTFEEVKEWLSQQSSLSDLLTAKELNEIIAANIPKYIKNL